MEPIFRPRGAVRPEQFGTPSLGWKFEQLQLADLEINSTLTQSRRMVDELATDIAKVPLLFQAATWPTTPQSNGPTQPGTL
jgi:hypothetical protein